MTTRRRFIQRSAAVVVGTTALSASRVWGANERVHVALMGCGARGRMVANWMSKAPDVLINAVCDVSDETIARAKSAEFVAKDAEGFKDFRKILDRKDVHALIVATPDHWHAIPTVLACAAGKDVYVEKPLALTIREGRKMVDAARKHNRIVQHGTQHRAAAHYKEIEEIIQRGEIGDVHFVRVWNYGGASVQTGSPDAEPPAGVDWEMYLGPAKKVPFNKQRFQGTFRRFFDYAGGYITDFGAHRIDSVLQVMRDDRVKSAYGVGGHHVKFGIEDTPDVLQVTYEFDKWTMSYEGIQVNNFGTGPRIAGGRVPYNAYGPHARPHGEAFYGTKGTIFSDRVGYELFPAVAGMRGGPNRRAPVDPGAPPAVPTEGELDAAAKGVKSVQGADRTDLHAANFIECVRSRKKPIAEVEIGHRSSVICHLGNISYRVGGRKVKWDGEKEQIVGDAEANAMVDRPARKPWDLI